MAYPSNASKKQSQFLSTDTIPGSAYFGLWDNGANYRISFANLLAGLGATGTLSQLGDGGQPLLYQAGADNYIRNLKAGFGVTLTQEATEEVTVAIGFTFDETGATLVDDVSSSTPAFRSLVAGSGISIAEAAGQIQISTGSPVPTSSVVIAQMSDFPAPSAGVITLAANTDYLIAVNTLSTANRFVMSNNTSISGTSRENCSITYTGTGDMFTWNDARVTFGLLTLNATSGTLFNGVNTTPGVYRATFNNVAGNCATLGTIGNVSGTRMSACSFNNTVDGLTYSGAIGFGLVESTFITQGAGTAIDFGTCTFDGFSIVNCVSTGGDPGVFFLDGLPNSGNVNAGGIGTFVNNRFAGLGSQTSGNITPNDALWQFDLNDKTGDTRPDSLLYVTGNATPTVISSAGAYVDVNATFVDARSSQFSNSTTGVATYIGGKNATLPITASASVLMATGGSKNVEIEIAINGVNIVGTSANGTCSSSQSARIMTVWQAELSPSDTVQVRVANNDDTTDIIVTDMVLRIN